jgi:hypothetical protein
MHDVLTICKFLAKISITKMYHPPYSPEAPCYFWLFPRLRNVLKGQRFVDIPDMQHNMMLLQGILANDFQDYF